MPLFPACRVVLLLLVAGSLAAAQSEGVLLPAKDYQTLLDEVEAAKKAKAAKPLPPSVCAIVCELKREPPRPTAVLTLTYQFRTVQPRSLVLLGGQRAFATNAALDSAGPPALDATADGLVALIETAGEHTLIVAFETAIAPRGAKGDLGFEISLPRAAITTLTLAPPNAELKSLTVSTRGQEAANKPGEVKATVVDAAKLAKSYPLGPTDLLELSWDVPQVAAVPSEPTLEAEIAVRADDAQIETTATLKLRGPARTWTLTLPAGAELTGNAAITRPMTAAKRDWTVSVPAGEATLTATQRQPRNDAKSFSIGPYFASGVRQSGTVKLFALPTLRLIARPASEVRRVDSPFAGDDGPVASFRYSLPLVADRKPVPLMECDVRPASGFVVVQPQHKLILTPLGWKLRSEYRITPVRIAVEQLTLELPAGWVNPALSPLELVEDVSGEGDASQPRTLLVRLATPQREPFEIVLEARWPVSGEARDATLPLPRWQGARERDAQVTASVTPAYELTGSVHEWDGSKIAVLASELTAGKNGVLAGTFESGAGRVDLAWQPQRPRVIAEIRSEVTLGDRQITVQQTFKLTIPIGTRPLRLKGAGHVVGFRATPPLEADGPGEWLFTPAADAKEATLTLSYAVPLKAGDARMAVPLFWPEATASTSTLRVWNTCATRRPVSVEGPWRESAPEPAADRDVLPAFTLSGRGSELPLMLELADADPTGSVVVDRAVIQWWMTGDGTVQGRARYVLQRWPASLEIAGAPGLTATVDKVRADAATAGELMRIVLPEAKATRTQILLELRFQGPPGAAWRPVALDPPRLRGAVFRQAARWQITPPEGNLPFTAGGALAPEQHWQATRFGFAPSAAATSDDLDRWLLDGAEGTGDSGDAASLTARQTLPAKVQILCIPHTPAMALAAAIAFAIGLLLARCAARLRTILFTVLLAMAVVSLALWPQPLSQIALLLQPALLLLLAALGSLSWLRRWQAQRAQRSATFTRATPSSISTPVLDRSAKRSRGSQPVPLETP